MKKPSEQEQEFFVRQEAAKRRKIAEEKARQLAESEKLRLRELHHMRCPKCGMELQEVTYREVKIDRCFDCGGTWLDPGELEQLAVVEAQGGGTLLGKVASLFKAK